MLNGCTDHFEEMNKNPNNPTEVPVHTLLPGLLRSLSRDNNEVSTSTTNAFMQMSFRPDQGAHLYAVEDYQPWWGTAYNSLKNIQYILNNAEKEGYEDYYGIALVLKVYTFSVLTNLYGDVPYSKAGLGKEENLYHAVYDKQEDIYAALIATLREANDLLGTGGIKIQSDIIFNGDATKWKKLANSLLVRLLIEQSLRIDPSDALQEILMDPQKYPLMSSNDDQPTFKYLTESGNTYPGSSRPYDLKVYQVTNILVDYLLATNDERIKAFADPVKADMPYNYKGVQAGELYTGNVAEISNVSALVWDSKDKPAIKTVWMSYSELLFLLAEAAEKGWIEGGSLQAEEYYHAGIEASYQFYYNMVEDGINKGISLLPMSQWDGSLLLEPGVAYTGNYEDKMEKIAWQQWLGLFNNLQSYFYWRRVGVPEFTPGSQTVNDQKIPVRFIYPLEERTLNGENYRRALEQQGADDLNTKMWLVK
jgi:hypothetical protein